MKPGDSNAAVPGFLAACKRAGRDPKEIKDRESYMRGYRQVMESRNPRGNSPPQHRSSNMAKAKKSTAKAAGAAKARAKKGAKATKASSASTNRVIDPSYRERYKKDPTVKTPGGAASTHIGDDVALALRGLDLKQLKDVARENQLHENWSRWENSNLNPGMRRMNLGNILRRAVKNPEIRVSILGETVPKAIKSREKEAKDKAAAKKAA